MDQEGKRIIRGTIPEAVIAAIPEGIRELVAALKQYSVPRDRRDEMGRLGLQQQFRNKVFRGLAKGCESRWKSTVGGGRSKQDTWHPVPGLPWALIPGKSSNRWIHVVLPGSAR